MSNQLTEINISPQNVYGKCDLKCIYNFKYKESNLTAKNNQINLSLTYENSSVPPVLYNNVKYNVSKIMLFSPSLHLFNDQKVDAELFIEHIPESGGANLFVCIPIVKSSDSTTASTLLSEVISSIGTKAPASNETTNLNLSGFTLDKIVPNKPFFSYSGKYSETSYDFIVFGKMYAISLSDKILSVLSSVIKPFPLPMLGNNLFLNPKGPNSGGSVGDGIYISCQPTGSSEEEIEITNNKDSTTYDMGSVDTSTIQMIIKIILGCIVFIIIFYIISYGFNLLAASSVSKNKTNIKS
jgi:hypothetical protein